MRKILTIDCWNTLVKPSGDKEAVIYLLSQRLRVPYDLLYHTVENLKERIKPEHHNVSNYMFWHYIKVELGLTIPVYRILAHAEEAYQMYSPQMINPDGWRDMVSTAQKNNFEVKILSNTGYLKSEWMNDWITHNFRFFDKVPFIGSDLIGIAKPNKEFYLTALDGDNLTGEGDGDDETITINIPAIEPGVESLVFAINIFGAAGKNQNFGMVRNAYVRVYNKENQQELVKFDLSEDYGTNTAVVAGKLYKHNEEWKFQAMGEGLVGDINDVVAKTAEITAKF